MAIKKRTISPRQKMINLMYVVLMAMLALNISSEVLNGFSIVEESLNRTTANSSKENEVLYGNFAEQMKANPQLAYYQRLFAQCSKMMLAIQKLPVPVIARVQGLATAAGCQLVAQCDLAVSVDTARFGVNGIDVGLFCATPSVPLVRNMQPKQAMEMLLTGGFIDAEEARARGLVNRVVPAEQLDAAVDALVNAILAKPREAIAAGKELFYRQSELGIEAAYQLAGQTMACNMMLDVAQEGVQAFIDKREPTWRRPAP